MKTLTLLLSAIALLFIGCAQPMKVSGPQLYAIDCGSIEVADMSPFDTAGRMKGKKEVLANPCFLIKHKEKYLIWDTGHPEAFAAKPEGVGDGNFMSKVDTTLTEQLKKLKLETKDIGLFALSHHHPDHSGNANLFGHATWIANEKERDHMFSTEMRSNTEFFKTFSTLQSSSTRTFSSEYDVFGDGKVIVHSTPGHTPGHSVLLVKLETSGALLLSGDLYTHENARELSTIPVFSWNKEELKKSRSHFNAIAKRESARVIIQHSKKDFDSLPKFPEFLD